MSDIMLVPVIKGMNMYIALKPGFSLPLSDTRFIDIRLLDDTTSRGLLGGL